MAYATGSGSYTDLMAAVLAFANADGWTLTGGDWPISKGNVRGVDWNTFTVAENDYTGGAPVPITARYIRLAVGNSPADATANLATTGNCAYVPNMHYTIDQWHIFSDPTVCDFIHVVVQFTNGYDAQVFGHFSFGEVEKFGMTYGGMAYVSAHNVRGYAPGNHNDRNNGHDAHSGIYARIKRHFTGRLGYSYAKYDVYNNFGFMVDSVDNPFPDNPLWPVADTFYGSGRLLDSYGPSSGSYEPENQTAWQGTNCKMNAGALFASGQPYSGGVTLGPLPCFIANTTSNSTALQFVNLGSFPDVRICRLNNFLPGDEVVYGGDTWKLFPFLCRKNSSTLGAQFEVTSGRYGLAYRKVV